MNSFLANSFFTVTIFSIVRLYASLFLASYFFPSDYGIIAIPIAFFALLEVLIDGGNSSAIINKNITKPELRTLICRRLKFIIMVSMIALISLSFINWAFLHNKVPYIVIVLVLINSIFKGLTFYFESRLIANGKFIFCETSSFISTLIAFVSTIFLINLIDLSGYSFLLINLLLQQITYAATLIYREHFLEINLKRKFQKEDISFIKYKNDVLKGAIVDQFRSRIDEMVISIYFAISNIGVYYKIKEFAITLSGFGSKAIARPWFYVSSVNPKSKTLRYWIIFSIICLALFPIFFNIFDFLINFFIIDVMGNNWTLLKEYTRFIYILAFLYFFYTFNKSTMLGLGFSNIVLSAEIISLVFRIFVYLIYLLVFINQYRLTIEVIFKIEIALWIMTIILQIIMIAYLFFKERPKISPSIK
jgi:hypothetical protein